MELLKLFSYYSLTPFTKNLDSLYNTGLGQNGLIFDDVGWKGGFKKGGNGIDDIYIVICNTFNGMETNN